MAEIVQNPEPTGQVGSTWDAIINIIANYWWVLLLFALIIGVLVLAFYIWKKKEENDRRRDSSVYATAMNLTEATELNAKADWIRKHYSFWNLLWLGIPFKWIEHSVRVVDLDRNFLGYYRGHIYTQGNDFVLLLYKHRIWLGLFEDKFLLYCPLKLRHIKVKETKTKDGKKIFTEEKDKNGNFVYEYEPLPKNFIIFETERANEIRISCNTITKYGNYYFFPSYVFNTINDKRHIDMTEHIASSIAKTNYLMQLETAYSDMSRMAGRAVEFNPHLRYVQKSPEKEKQIEEDNNEQPTR